MPERVVQLVERDGPRTGAELLEAIGCEAFALWRTCLRSPDLAVRRIGRRYVRLDRRVDGYARLSPSILREFLTYSVVGLAADEAAIEERARLLNEHIVDVSQQKLALATSIMAGVARSLGSTGGPETRFCVAAAGDIVYQMGHDVNRPERSTGRLVHGSDLDVVVIVADDAPDDLVTRLDTAIYKKKFQYLTNPAFHEEIDYVVKRFDTLRGQAEFDTFRRMVACKILDEAVLIYGSAELFAAAQALLGERGVVDRLRAMERTAVEARERQERYLLDAELRALGGDDLLLFHTTDESEEFE